MTCLESLHLGWNLRSFDVVRQVGCPHSTAERCLGEVDAFVAVLNRDGGTLRTTDLDAFSARMRETLEGAGHIRRHSHRRGRRVGWPRSTRPRHATADVVLAGGGDGTISAAAGDPDGQEEGAGHPAGRNDEPVCAQPRHSAVARRRRARPSPTARSGRSMSPAPTAVPSSTSSRSACMPGWSILRSKMEFGSQARQDRRLVQAPPLRTRHATRPRLTCRCCIGDAEIVTRTDRASASPTICSAKATCPMPTRRTAACSASTSRSHAQRSEMLRFVLNMARGKWRDNQQVEIHEAEEVTLTIRLPAQKVARLRSTASFAN